MTHPARPIATHDTAELQRHERAEQRALILLRVALAAAVLVFGWTVWP